MVKLTPEVIEDARMFVNPVQDRELDLRNYKIPAIESLGSTYNQFDNIDLTDNDLRRLENIPVLPRLKSLFLANNRISFIDPELGQSLQHLHTLVLTNNNLSELGDLEGLATLPKLEYLSLLGNPVTKKAEYRAYLIHRCGALRVLDFQRIREKERQGAAALFKGKKGRALAAQLSGQRSQVAAAAAPSSANSANSASSQQSSDAQQRIAAAIAAAGTLDEVANLQQLLNAGHVPGQSNGSSNAQGSGDGAAAAAMVEEEEAMEAES